jgi:hypothetical protein
MLVREDANGLLVGTESSEARWRDDVFSETGSVVGRKSIDGEYLLLL